MSMSKEAPSEDLTPKQRKIIARLQDWLDYQEAELQSYSDPKVAQEYRELFEKIKGQITDHVLNGKDLNPVTLNQVIENTFFKIETGPLITGWKYGDKYADITISDWKKMLKWFLISPTEAADDDPELLKSIYNFPIEILKIISNDISAYTSQQIAQALEGMITIKRSG